MSVRNEKNPAIGFDYSTPNLNINYGYEHINRAGLSQYQEFVRQSRFPEENSTGWQKRSATYILQEQYELTHQHQASKFGHPADPKEKLITPMAGDAVLSPDFDRLNQINYGEVDSPVSIEMGQIALMNWSDGYGQINQESAERSVRSGMADEIGDLIWFLTDVADRQGWQLEDLLNYCLYEKGVTLEAPITNFNDFQKTITLHSGNISIAQNPSNKENSTARLSEASLELASNYLGLPDDPISESKMEDPKIIGDLFMIYSYYASAKLGVSLQQIADFNQQKILHRREFNKEYGMCLLPSSQHPDADEPSR